MWATRRFRPDLTGFLATAATLASIGPVDRTDGQLVPRSPRRRTRAVAPVGVRRARLFRHETRERTVVAPDVALLRNGILSGGAAGVGDPLQATAARPSGVTANVARTDRSARGRSVRRHLCRFGRQRCIVARPRASRRRASGSASCGARRRGSAERAAVVVRLTEADRRGPIRVRGHARPFRGQRRSCAATRRSARRARTLTPVEVPGIAVAIPVP